VTTGSTSKVRTPPNTQTVTQLGKRKNPSLNGRGEKDEIESDLRGGEEKRSKKASFKSPSRKR